MKHDVARVGEQRRRRAVAVALLTLVVLGAGAALAAGCGGGNDTVSAKRQRTALQGRIEDELGDAVTTLSRTARPTDLPPGWRKVQDGAWFHPQSGFVPTLFVIETPVDAQTTVRDVLDGGRDHDAEANDNFRAVGQTTGPVMGGVPGMTYVNAFDIEGKGVTVTGALAIVDGHLFNAYVTSTTSATRTHRAEYGRLLAGIAIARRSAA